MREPVVITIQVPVPGSRDEVTVQVQVDHPLDAPRWMISKALDEALAQARLVLWSK